MILYRYSASFPFPLAVLDDAEDIPPNIELNIPRLATDGNMLKEMQG
jgi:hypothetical protein